MNITPPISSDVHRRSSKVDLLAAQFSRESSQRTIFVAISPSINCADAADPVFNKHIKQVEIEVNWMVYNNLIHFNFYKYSQKVFN